MLTASGLGLARTGGWRLQPLDLRLEPGEVLGILGPNGAGKSSLLALLAGDLVPSHGEARLNGRVLRDWPGPARARQLAVLPQSAALAFDFTVSKVVAFGRTPHGIDPAQDRLAVRDALAACDLERLQDRSYLRVSGGERQRTQLARVLAQLWPATPGKVLLLDEPTAALDPRHQHRVMDLARAAAGDGVAVAAVLHDINLAARYCDRLLLLAGGQPMALGPPADVLQPAVLEAVFGLQVLIQRHPELDHPLVLIR